MKLKCAAFPFWLLVLLTGCVHSTSHRTTLPPQVRDSHLLYLQPQPYRSLYVEVDAVQGGEPSEAELARLKTVLHQCCEKPDGITIVRSSIIPRSAARGNSAVSLARRYMDGPAGISNAAYLYILFYDNRVNQNLAQSPRAATQSPARDTVPTELANQENPHVNLFPYPAMVYIDRSWMSGLLPDKYRPDLLAHETGHALGLVRRESQINNFHCPTKSCSMTPSVRLRNIALSWFKRDKLDSQFCEKCVAELRQSQTSTNGTSMRFVGPVLVRTMPSYHVLSLPDACALYIGDSLEKEIPGFIAEFRKHNAKPSRQEELWSLGRADLEQDRALQAIQAAKEDPAETIREMAVRLETQVRAEPRGDAAAK